MPPPRGRGNHWELAASTDRGEGDSHGRSEDAGGRGTRAALGHRPALAGHRAHLRRRGRRTALRECPRGADPGPARRRAAGRLHEQDYIQALGALTGSQAVQQAKAGLQAIYLSGWQVAADANQAGHTCHGGPAAGHGLLGAPQLQSTERLSTVEAGGCSSP
jgi:hypothetical protein